MYSLQLVVLAQFSGLRHVLNTFPLTSSVMGVTFVIGVITFAFMLPLLRSDFA